jgi:DMSO/TMAO reductase YedYZ heme-binding membrane subunit
MTLMTKFFLKYSFHIITAAAVVMLVAVLVLYGQTIDAAQAMARFTARMSFAVFAIVFSASSLYRFFPSDLTASLLRSRRRLGITFAFAHTIHLVALALFVSMSEARPQITRVAGGALAYLLIFAMALTSSDAAVKRMGARSWKALHTGGVFYIWLAFFLTYLPRLQGKLPQAGETHAEFIVMMSLVITIMLLRLSSMLAPRKKAV